MTTNRTPEQIDAQIEQLRNTKKKVSMRQALKDNPELEQLIGDYKAAVNVAKRGFGNNANSHDNRIENYTKKIDEIIAQKAADSRLLDGYPSTMDQVNNLIETALEAGDDPETLYESVSNILDSEHQDYLQHQSVASSIRNGREQWLKELKAPRRKSKNIEEEVHPLEMDVN